MVSSDSPPTFHPQLDPAGMNPLDPPPLPPTPNPTPPPAPPAITSLLILPTSSPPPVDHTALTALRSSHVVYISRVVTGQPLLQVGLSQAEGSAPSPENSTAAVDGLEGVEWKVVSDELPGGMWVWTASDAHPVDELGVHPHPYVSDVQVRDIDEAETMKTKGWQTIDIVSSRTPILQLLRRHCIPSPFHVRRLWLRAVCSACHSPRRSRCVWSSRLRPW